jgi:amino acid transporter
MAKGTEIRGEALLRQYGYRQELDRALSTLSAVGLTLSDITPTASFFVIAAAVYPMAGTGAFWSFLLAGVIALSVAFSMGELGAQYPIAGGLYSIVARVLGRPLGFLAMTDYVMQAIFLPAAIALGIGSYMSMLVPAVNPNLWATLIMLAVTLISVLRVKTNANITGVFLAIELIVVVTVAVLGFTHPHRSLTALFHPVLVNAHGVVTPVSAGVIVASIAIALFSYNGYDSAINFSEETDGEARHVGQAVVTAASLGVLFQVVPTVAVLFGVEHLGAFFTNPLPVAYFLKQYLGTTGTNIMLIGVALAVFNATLAIVLQFSRVIYSTARDGSWPAPVNRALSLVSPRFRTPWVSVLFVGLLGAVLTLFSSVISAITFTSVLIITLYALIAIAAMVNRVRNRTAVRPFTMWLFPLPPIIALVGVSLALSQQKPSDLLTVAIIFAIGLIYYFAYPARQSAFWCRGADAEGSRT